MRQRQRRGRGRSTPVNALDARPAGSSCDAAAGWPALQLLGDTCVCTKPKVPRWATFPGSVQRKSASTDAAAGMLASSIANNRRARCTYLLLLSGATPRAGSKRAPAPPFAPGNANGAGVGVEADPSRRRWSTAPLVVYVECAWPAYWSL